jgi:hypothetical protein
MSQSKHQQTHGTSSSCLNLDRISNEPGNQHDSNRFNVYDDFI